MKHLAEETIRIIEAYWSTEFGCTPAHFHAAQTLVVPHAGLRGYHGISCFHHQQSLLMSVPPDLLVNARAAAERLAAKTLADAVPVALLAGAKIERAIGPATIDYADRGTVRLHADARARLLTLADETAIERFQAACHELEWEHGGSEGSHEQAGTFVGDVLTALASYQVWGGRIAHIAIVSHPHYRGHGLGTAAVATLAGAAVERGLILQYRTLQHNIASRGIALALGFIPWATTTALQLRSLEP